MKPNTFISKIGNTVWFTLSRIKQIHDFFIAEINYRQRISEKLNRYITALYYFDKVFIILPGADNDFSYFLFTTVIVTSEGIASVSNSLVFSVDNRIVRMFFGLLARMNYIFLYTRHSIENISKALIDSDISHEEFKPVVYEEQIILAWNKASEQKTTN